mgnify:CR=1 FL=1
MIYSIDTSALVDGWRRYYPPDVFPGLWDRISELVEDGRIIATEEVLVELEKGDDDLHKWALAQKQMFVPLDEDVQNAATAILAAHPLVSKNALGPIADPFVIALAQVRGCTVISGEVWTNSTVKTKIPNVCAVLGVNHINFLEFIREQRWVFGR